MNKNRFYVYGLFDPAETFPFYIGKGTGDRIKHHFREFKKERNLHKDNKIEKIKRQSREPYAEKFYEGLTEEEAYMREWCLINLYYDKLTNIDSTYGRGTKSGKQHPWYGENHTEEWKEKMSEKMKGQNNPMYGKSRNLSEETKRKIGEAQKRTTLTEEHIQKLTGREFTEEHRQNMAEAKKGEKNPKAKLDRKEAAQIKWLTKNTKMYQRKIAEKYNVDQGLVSKISREKNWKNVTPAKPHYKIQTIQMFKIIAAVDEEGGMGKNGDLPWTIRNDLSFFRFMTFGDPVVMGRKTFENTGSLPGRDMIVLTSQQDYDKGDFHAHNIAGVRLYTSPHQTTWIGGGASVYEQYIGSADEVVLSRVEGSYGCDLFFPMDGLETHYEKIGEFSAEGFTASRYELI